MFQKYTVCYVFQAAFTENQQLSESQQKGFISEQALQFLSVPHGKRFYDFRTQRKLMWMIFGLLSYLSQFDSTLSLYGKELLKQHEGE